MKRKFLSVLVALVLACSLGMVTAVPATAQADGSLYLVSSGGTGGVATWSTTPVKFGTYSAALAGGTDVGASYGQVWAPVNIPLANITDVSFWYYLSSTAQADYSAWPVYKQEGQTYTDGTGYVTPYVTLEISDGTDTHWVISQPFARDPDGGWTAGWEQWSMSDNASEYPVTSGMDPDQALWHDESFTDNVTTGGSGAYPAGWEYLSYFQSLYVGYNVVKLKIAMGWWAFTTDQSAYVDDMTINTATYELERPPEPLTVDEDRVECPDAYFQTIQGAIDCAVAGETVMVYDGTYNAASGETFPLTVDKALTIKSVSGAADTSIEPTSSDESGFNVTAAGVTIGGSGFTIVSGGRAGIYVDVTGGNGITVQDCIFKSYADGESRGMWFEKLWNGALVTGNSFTTPRVGTGIMVVNADNATISNNTVATGTVKYCFLTFKAEAFYPARNPPTPFAEYVATSASTINNLLVTGNSITGMDASRHAIVFDASTKTADHGEPQAQDLTVGSGGVTISRNTFTNTSSSVGVGIDADTQAPNDASQVAHIYGVGNILINYNSFTGITTPYYAVDNNQTTIVNAKYNWWDAVSGPVDDESKNPYRAEAVTAGAEKCLNADFLPWMIHTELASGWNIYSTPIAAESDPLLPTKTDTIDEALDLWGSSSGDKLLAYYYYNDGETGYWDEVTSLTPLQAVYIKMAAAATIDVVVSSDATFPPSTVMYTGWNLVGPAELEEKLVNTALLDAYLGTGVAADLQGYSKALSPPLHQSNWTYLRDGTATDKFFVPTEGYWVFMVNQGILGGLTTTPITYVP